MVHFKSDEDLWSVPLRKPKKREGKETAVKQRSFKAVSCHPLASPAPLDPSAIPRWVARQGFVLWRGKRRVLHASGRPAWAASRAGTLAVSSPDTARLFSLHRGLFVFRVVM